MYYPGTTSKSRLIGIHPDLSLIVGAAYVRSPIDLAVADGVRNLDTQRRYVEMGVSKTLDSKHLLQKDGTGWAVDLVPYIGGRLCWERLPILLLAECVRDIAIQFKIPIRWGGVWDRMLNELDEDLGKEVASYAERMGGTIFFDGPHFEKV